MRLLSALLLLAFVWPLRAQAADCDLPAGPSVSVTKALDGETLLLDDGGQVRLAGIVAPRSPRWWRQKEPWPTESAARDALAHLAEGRTVTLHLDGMKKDRRGRRLAQVYSSEGGARIWLQGRLVEKGRVRAYAHSGIRACAGALLGLEATARKSGLGLWRQSAYRVLDAADPLAIIKRRQSLVIVEGHVSAVGRAQNWRFVNFGDDWKSDFTIAVARSDLTGFAEAGIELETLKGAHVRVRGWVERWNGPAIKVTNPDQIEILEMPAASAETAQEKNPGAGGAGARSGENR